MRLHRSNRHSFRLDGATYRADVSDSFLNFRAIDTNYCDQPSKQLLYVTRLESTIFQCCVCVQFTFINYQASMTLVAFYYEQCSLEVIITTRCAQFHTTISNTNYFLHNSFMSKRFLPSFVLVLCVNIA